MKFRETEKERKFQIHTSRDRYGWRQIEKVNRFTQKSMNICLGKGNMNTDGYEKRLGET